MIRQGVFHINHVMAAYQHNPVFLGTQEDNIFQGSLYQETDTIERLPG